MADERRELYRKLDQEEAYNKMDRFHRVLWHLEKANQLANDDNFSNFRSMLTNATVWWCINGD
jgi:hypothetical protein